MTLKVYTQKDFDKLRTLALMSQVIDKKDLREFMDKSFDEYWPINPVLVPLKEEVRKKTFVQDYVLWEQDVNSWWYLYMYVSCMGWVYNGYLDGYVQTFANTSDTALKKLERTLSNESIKMLRKEAEELVKEVAKNPPTVEVEMQNGKVVGEANENTPEAMREKLTLHVEFMWQSREDRKVCSICNDLEGTRIKDIPSTMPHLNCRCDFIVYEWWTNEKGEVVADRRYEIEQNTSVSGPGYNIRQAKVTSEFEGKKRVTTFEVLKDGTTRKQTYEIGGK